MALESYESFEAVKARLDEIVDAVNDENLPLDEALALYEEAVGLGLRASDLLEEHIETQQADDDLTNEPSEGEPLADADADAGASASTPPADAPAAGDRPEFEGEPVHEGSSLLDVAVDAAASA